jgi:hypothetical protein
VIGLNTSNSTILRVSYMRLTEAPSVPHPHTGAESIALEQMTLAAYLDLYRFMRDSGSVCTR